MPSGQIIRKFSVGPYGESGALAYNGGLWAEPELRGPGPPRPLVIRALRVPHARGVTSLRLGKPLVSYIHEKTRAQSYTAIVRG